MVLLNSMSDVHLYSYYWQTFPQDFYVCKEGTSLIFPIVHIFVIFGHMVFFFSYDSLLDIEIGAEEVLCGPSGSRFWKWDV